MIVRGYEIKPRAKLIDANLKGADLRGAKLRGVKLPPFQICPQEGSFYGYNMIEADE